MHTLISNAVHKFISAPFYLRFPAISDLSWETTLACTERDLDAKRSHGLLALHLCLEQSLIRAAKITQDVPDLEPLREVMLSDDVLERLLLKSGVCDSCGGPQSEQVSRAFLVFVDMAIMDGGIEQFASWFAGTFDPIISVAFEACIGQPRSAGTSPTKRRSLVSDGAASKRRRTSLETSAPSPLISTLSVLQRLRQRQMLSAPGNFTDEIRVVLDILPAQHLEGDLAEQMAQISVQQEFLSPAASPVTPTPSPVSPSAARKAFLTQDHDEVGWKSYQESLTFSTSPFYCPTVTHPIPVYVTPDESRESPIFASIELDAHHASPSPLVSRASSQRDIRTSIPVYVSFDDSQQSTISNPPELQTRPASPVLSDSGVFDTQSLISTTVFEGSRDLDREVAAIVFIIETIDMVKRGELLPTPPIAATTVTTTALAETEHHCSAAYERAEGKPFGREVSATPAAASAATTKPVEAERSAVHVIPTAAKPSTGKARPDANKSNVDRPDASKPRVNNPIADKHSADTSSADNTNEFSVNASYASRPSVSTDKANTRPNTPTDKPNVNKPSTDQPEARRHNGNKPGASNTNKANKGRKHRKSNLPLTGGQRANIRQSTENIPQSSSSEKVIASR
ncbi:hypothetical protein B0H12DRAFT_1105904 [Mycena haematopus]|nr:hypothetical protein B0H12DRAFT_1105904 [Mycena haematopus]